MQSLGVPEPILSNWNRVIERCSESPEAESHNNRTDKLPIGDITASVCGHFMFVNEADSICRFLDAPTNTVDEATKFVCRRCAPLLLVVRVTHELSVVEHFT